jgi:hypothetical protein
MSPKKQTPYTPSWLRLIRDQRFVIDALEAQLVLCAPEDESRLKERVAAERKALQDLEAKFVHQPKSKLTRSSGSS